MKILRTIPAKPTDKQKHIIEVDDSELKLFEMAKSRRVRKGVGDAINGIPGLINNLVSAFQASAEYWNTAYPTTPINFAIKQVEVKSKTKRVSKKK